MNKIRLLKSSDVPQLHELSRQAGWNQTPQDWERTLALTPDGCFGIEQNGGIVSSTTTIVYGNELAWIGMVLTLPEFRGQGFASLLLDYAIRHVRGSVQWIKLDATEQGRPIYAGFGFQDECPIERWKRRAGRGPKPDASGLVHRYVVDPSFDRAYFGSYRVPLLNALLKQEAGYIMGYGYAMGRPGERATYFGPCVVRTRDAARQLVEWFVSQHHSEDIYWDLFPDNKDAVQLAIDYGFEPDRHLMRMALPTAPGIPPLVRNNASVFAIAGFEYG